MKLNLAGRIVILASATFIVACDDDPKPAADTSTQTDTAVNEDTTVEEDVAVNEDTTVEEDVAVVEDTTVEEDVAVVEDTTVEEDVAVVEDTTVEEDVAVVEDTTVEEDVAVVEDTTVADPCAAGDGPVFTVTAASTADYTINGDNDPALTVVRGCTYTFNMDAGTNHPFRINTVQGTGTANSYDVGVTGNGTSTGTITWVVANDAPAGLFYNCQNHLAMTSSITVIDPAN